METSAEMPKNLNILRILSSEGLLFEIVAAIALEFLKTYKSNGVFKTQGKLKDSGLFLNFFPFFKC